MINLPNGTLKVLVSDHQVRLEVDIKDDSTRIQYAHIYLGEDHVEKLQEELAIALMRLRV